MQGNSLSYVYSIFSINTIHTSTISRRETRQDYWHNAQPTQPCTAPPKSVIWRCRTHLACLLASPSQSIGGSVLWKTAPTSPPLMSSCHVWPIKGAAKRSQAWGKNNNHEPREVPSSAISHNDQVRITAIAPHSWDSFHQDSPAIEFLLSNGIDSRGCRRYERREYLARRTRHLLSREEGRSSRMYKSNG